MKRRKLVLFLWVLYALALAYILFVRRFGALMRLHTANGCRNAIIWCRDERFTTI